MPELRAIALGDLVTLAFEGRLDDGRVFDTATTENPLRIEIGAPFVLPGFWRALLGLKAGQGFEFRLAPEEAFGHRDERLVYRMPKEAMDPQIAIGESFRARADRKELTLRYVALEGDHCVLDGNPPLAGRTLTYCGQILAVEAADFSV